MSVISNPASLRLTPKNRLYSQPLGKPVREDTSFYLSLNTIIGTTTCSANSFDSLHESQSFALCAGSTVVLAHVDEQLNVTQRFFRARPDAGPVNVTPSFYNSATSPIISDSRSRPLSSSKDVGCMGGGTALTSGSPIVDSPGRAKANKRTRDATCISLSPGGKFLAVGETGYQPRILLFSTAADAPSDVPLSSLTEHSYGVRACAFSSDSRWLCSLGNLHDGFVYLWSINPKTASCKLLFSNKVTSFVQNIAWMGSSVISVGTRHVKVWRLEQTLPTTSAKTRFDAENVGDMPPGSPAPKTFFGRNCLLGTLLNAVFTCVVAISESKAVLCTDKGDICLLDDTDRAQRLDKIAQVDFSILCVTLDSTTKSVWMAGGKGEIWALALDELNRDSVSQKKLPSLKSLGSLANSEHRKGPDTIAIGFVRDRIVTVNADHVIEIRDPRLTHNTGAEAAVCKQLPAHESAVLGVSMLHQHNSHGAEFFTWSIRGTMLFWLLDGSCRGKLQIVLEQLHSAEEGDQNELRVVRASETADFFISGDRAGVLRLMDCTGKTTSFLRAHIGDVNDLALIRRDVNNTFIVSCGRDRTLQLFRKNGDHLSLQQTLDDHASSVLNVLFLDNGSTLLSSSSDRTIIMRTISFGSGESVAFIPMRVITLKASPVAFSTLAGSNLIVVSTMDRQIQKYDMSTGRLVKSFKALDHTGSDSLVMSSLTLGRLGNSPGEIPVIFGVSSTDRSISIFDYETGSLLAKEYGQSVVSDVALSKQTIDGDNSAKLVVSTGLDGTIMIWSLAARSQFSTESVEILKSPNVIEPLKNHTSALAHPLRRILSRSEISDFQKSQEDIGDPLTPTRSRSPSRMKRKTSKYTLANGPKVALPPLPTSTQHSPSSSSPTDTPGRKFTRDRSPTPPSPNVPLASRSRRPSPDGRHRRKSTGNLNDLNTVADQICRSLRVYRRKLSSSKDNPKNETALELERELTLTLQALREKTANTKAANETVPGDLLDTYLAKMIDERLAILTKPKDAASPNKAAEGADSPLKPAASDRVKARQPTRKATGDG